ncbi:hypothetical protein PVAP13_4KG285600 [Panicum virgatum]|uniref:Uncharacterized protein n=1 Tax=Panicum virgatum TaxID=38727 RepID=A0A8T0TTD3_PANVG|nr:hypothetical protein PVAP13_4KG285600 [Panicum virgatum]
MRRYSKKKKNRCGHAALCSPAIPCAARARASRASCSASSPRPRDSLRLRRPCLPHQRHPRPCRPGDLCSASSPRPPRFPAPPASVLPRRAAKPAPAGDYLVRRGSCSPHLALPARPCAASPRALRLPRLTIRSSPTPGSPFLSSPRLGIRPSFLPSPSILLRPAFQSVSSTPARCCITICPCCRRREGKARQGSLSLARRKSS